MKNKRIEIIVISAVLILQTVLYIVFGTQKAYIHMDEAYSFGLASYDKTEIQDNADFYNNWHDSDYFADYLRVDEDEIYDFSPVYKNQINDVHPPLYYLLLRLFMGASVGTVTFWTGLVLNIIISLFISVFIYMISQKLLANQRYIKEKSAFVTLITACTSICISNVMYIRMYCLVTLFIVMTLYMHINLLNEERLKPRNLVAMAAVVICGAMTHYYYLFFILPLFFLFIIKYVREKAYRNMLMYIATYVVSVMTYVSIFPYAFDHLFSGYRGEGVTDKLLDFAKLQNRIFDFLSILNEYAFNMIFFLVFGLIIFLQCYRCCYSAQTTCGNSSFMLVCVPSAVYFAIASICSPYTEPRYILPIGGLIVMVSLCYTVRLLSDVCGEIYCGIISVFLAVLMCISPIFLELSPSFIFEERVEAAEAIRANSNLPALYTFNPNHNRFLDDIYLFCQTDESYITKDIEINRENIIKIFDGKNTSDGIIVYINGGWENDKVIGVISEALGLKTVEYVSRLNACDIYRLS